MMQREQKELLEHEMQLEITWEHDSQELLEEKRVKLELTQEIQWLAL